MFKCNFCNKSINKNKQLVSGKDSYICEDCIKVCSKIIEDKKEKQNNSLLDLSVNELKAKVGKIVKGQNNLIDTLINNIVVYNLSNSKIKPHTIVTGASGTGKTLTIETVAKILDIPFISVNMGTITETGFAGDSFGEVFKEVKEITNSTKPKRAIIFLDEFDKIFKDSKQKDKKSVKSSLQYEILKLLENGKIGVGSIMKKEFLDLSNVLFILGGAFGGRQVNNINDLLNEGLAHELIGRITTVVKTNNIDNSIIKDIIHSSSLVKDYQVLLKKFEINKPKTLVVKEIKESVIHSEISLIGARAINQAINTYYLKELNTNNSFKEKKVA